MRWSEVARAAPLLPLVPLASLLPVEAALEPELLVLVSEFGEVVLEPERFEEPLVVLEAPAASEGVLVLDDPPLVLPDAPDVPDVPDVPLDVPDAPDAPDASFEVPEVPDAPPDVPLAPPDVPLAPPEDGRLRSTSPLEVPPVVPPVDALPVDGTQLEDAIPVLALAPEVVPEVVPMPLVLDPLVLLVAPAAPPVVVPALIPPVVPAAPLVLPLADRVVVSVPVPFAPLVVFSPVKR